MDNSKNPWENTRPELAWTAEVVGRAIINIRLLYTENEARDWARCALDAGIHHEELGIVLFRVRKKLCYL